jgi:hypothetical protein
LLSILTDPEANIPNLLGSLSLSQILARSGQSVVHQRYGSNHNDRADRESDHQFHHGETALASQ